MIQPIDLTGRDAFDRVLASVVNLKESCGRACAEITQSHQAAGGAFSDAFLTAANDDVQTAFQAALFQLFGVADDSIRFDCTVNLDETPISVSIGFSHPTVPKITNELLALWIVSHSGMPYAVWYTFALQEPIEGLQ